MIFLGIFCFFISSTQTFAKGKTDYIFPCYYVYEPQNLKPELIPTDLCTHIILIGCIHENSEELSPSIIKKPYNCSNVLKKVAYLKKQNPSIKTIISLATNATAMHQIVQNESKIDSFVMNALNLATSYGYDGIDFDWEYPCNEDKFKFSMLLQKFRFQLEKNKLNLQLSAAIGAGINIIKDCFDLEGLSKYLDFINVMCYDYNTIYNTYTAYSSPLYARPEEKGYDALLNSNSTIYYLIEQNVPRKKIVLGLNAGGHTFQLKDSKKNGFHAAVNGIGYSGGWSLYPQLCRLIQNGGTAVYDEVAQVLYAFYDDQWANTGDVRSAKIKVDYAKKLGLAGIFTWCLNWDDIDNSCGQNVKFPIHRIIKENLLE